MKTIRTILTACLLSFSAALPADNSNPIGVQSILLDEFTYETLNDQVKLKWTSLTETNSWRFVIERSIDGILFETVGEIAAAGNSSMPRYYEVTDSHPVNGTSYYRLRERDHNGVYDELSITPVTIHISSKPPVYPNPVERGCLVRFSPAPDVTVIELRDFSGSLIYTIPCGTLDSPQLPACHKLEPGIYIVRMYSPGSVQSTLLQVR